MTEFVSFDPDVEVQGGVLAAWIAGTQGKVMPYLDQQGITEVDPEGWYNLQAALDGLRAFSQMSSLFNAGLLIPEHAVFPPGIETLQDVLAALDTAYHMNHRNGEIGHYRLAVVDDHHMQMAGENPYPCEFDFGLLTYLARHFPLNGTEAEVIVTHDPDAPCRKDGADSCTYHLTW
jgi:hypothetical protein